MIFYGECVLVHTALWLEKHYFPMGYVCTGAHSMRLTIGGCVCADTHSIAPGSGNHGIPSTSVVLEICNFLGFRIFGVCVCGGTHSIAPGSGNQ